ncbi:NUMOD4 domain-containing protein [Chryseobacterium sp. WLY505]|uniref:NUMOD4 domain-containing protein n=1 Tax=Chryseobacterium sp. WLY505 TaxID=3068892 RepID=UPI002796DB60|nr:NUMOD4 domain-containing protein [Chryseobacterium sp. WLY505]MDQ1855740.1 NUMOD4 domain-containing protein [Chryseobacterium sp. WLY505]
MKGLITVKDTLSTDLQDLPGEIWEDLPGYVGRYEISNYSRVKSMIKRKALILKKSISNGRFKVALTSKTGKIKCENVGRICASVFLRSPEDNEVLEYLDKNVLNDAFFNLRWRTWQSVNLEKAKKQPYNQGEKNGMATLSYKKALLIRNERKAGKTYSELSLEHKVSVPCLQKVIANKTWKTA